MARLSAKLRSQADNRIAYWCQGCESCHAVRVNVERDGWPAWTWDGNVDAPTFSPSVLVTYDWHGDDGEPDLPERCHTFIRGGIVEFLGDCTHKFAGQTLPLPDWPYAEGEYGGV